MDITRMRVDVEAILPAEPATVWDLVADLSRIGEWSPECKKLRWLDPDDGGAAARSLSQPRSGPRVGTRFEAVNQDDDGGEWTVRGQVIEAERPRTFAWVVFDGPDEVVERPSTIWRYSLSPVADGTRVRESMQHGPGDSGVLEAITARPDQAREIVEGRTEQLRAHMLTTLQRMATTLS